MDVVTGRLASGMAMHHDVLKMQTEAGFMLGAFYATRTLTEHHVERSFVMHDAGWMGGWMGGGMWSWTLIVLFLVTVIVVVVTRRSRK